MSSRFFGPSMRRRMRYFLAFLFVSCVSFTASAAMAACSSYPYPLTNGITADGNHVQQDLDCAALLSGSTMDSTNFTGTTTFSGPVVPSSTDGIVGTTSGNNANPGSVGEYISSNIPLGAAVSLTSLTAASVTSVSLSAGDWDCSGNIFLNPGGSTTTWLTVGWISTLASQPSPPNNGMFYSMGGGINTSAGGSYSAPIPTGRISISTTTNVYLGVNVGFSSGANAAYGFIGCRRMR